MAHQHEEREERMDPLPQRATVCGKEWKDGSNSR